MITVISEIAPRASGTFPVVDVGNVRGAYWSVPTVTDRDAINANNRRAGMLVHCQDTNLSYRLVGGIANGNWSVDAGNTNYYATGVVAASSWTIVHNLGYNPSVTIVDASGDLCLGRISYTNNTSLNILFSRNVTGSGYFS